MELDTTSRGSHHTDGDTPLLSQFPIHLTSLGMPLQPQILTLRVPSLTSTLLFLGPIDKNVFLVSSE